MFYKNTSQVSLKSVTKPFRAISNRLENISYDAEVNASCYLVGSAIVTNIATFGLTALLYAVTNNSALASTALETGIGLGLAQLGVAGVLDIDSGRRM